jgi:hypothetical protein
MSRKAILPIFLLGGPTIAHDDGRHAREPLYEWFDSLQSKNGSCCSDADDTAVVDADWESHDGYCRVRIEDRGCNMPDEAVIKERNRGRRTIEWPGQIFRLQMENFMTSRSDQKARASHRSKVFGDENTRWNVMMTHTLNSTHQPVFANGLHSKTNVVPVGLAHI